MSQHDQVYDILDIIRVIHRAAVPVIFVPIIVSVLVGFWTFTSIRDVGFTERVYAVFRVPTSSIEVDEIERSVLVAATALGEDDTAFDAIVEELPIFSGTPYRAVRVVVESKSHVDGRAVLDSAAQMVAASVDAFDADLRRQLSVMDERRTVISGYLSKVTEFGPVSSGGAVLAEASTVASLVSAASVLDQDVRRLEQLGQGPLQFLTPIAGPESLSNLRWLRFPIVAWVAALLAVLFVAFTLDGVRLARANGLRKV